AQQCLCRARARLGFSFFFQNASFVYLLTPCIPAQSAVYLSYQPDSTVCRNVQNTANFLLQLYLFCHLGFPSQRSFLCVCRVSVRSRKLPDQESGPYETRSLTDVEPRYIRSSN